MAKNTIRKAILPVAGFGTRFLPATKAQPKEMLPVVDKPVVQYIVEELVASGIEDIIFVTGRGKRAIEDHFDISYELEDTLVQKQKHELVKAVQDIPNLARFTFVRQKTAKGDGDAINQAAHLIGKDEAVIVVFGDCLYDSKTPNSKQLIKAYDTYNAPIIGLAEVPMNEVSKFGVIDGKQVDKKIWKIKSFVEKPKKEEAPSNIVVPGKYILTPEVFKRLGKLKEWKSGEQRLADVFDAMLQEGKPLYGCMLDGEWLDTGDKFNFVKATIHLGMKHPEIGEKLREYIRNLQIK
ncbi:MAG: UTP--glucose-1-phosphate uridylyltransferase [Candidatus Paceibacterota bacterium]|jgi:UTP--glucose-1-phosphate uridylyltransferase|nr:UTP--glucose-1-phosphate uridylyltransferase [Candidatus Paceibacterota bacterium]